jgi:NADPH:quinone reductase-like Zn-dependent oxidoreductase
MKAAYIMKNGGPEVLEYGDVPDPVPGPGEVLVDIHAASVNGADWKGRSGEYRKMTEFPYILGRDFSGVVSGLGPGATDFKVGDEVFGVSEQTGENCYAEKVAMNQKIVAHKPASLSHVETAALGLIGLTALVSIEDTIKLEPGEKILIQGGAGGVASFAVQLAKHIGAHVITTASAANHDYLRRLGADEIIDYNTQDFTKVVKDVDAVFETVGGGELVNRSFSVLRPGGRAAFIGSGANAPESPRKDVVSLRPKVARDRAHLERIAELATSGAVKVPEIKVFKLSEAAEAHKISQGRHLRGKLVFKIR